MKKTIFLAALIAAGAAQAQVYVRPHVTHNGTYVEGHQRTAPDHNLQNNYSTQGNVNPDTGQQGTVNPYNQPQPNPYAQPNPYQQPSYGQPQCRIASNGQYVCR